MSIWVYHARLDAVGADLAVRQQFEEFDGEPSNWEEAFIATLQRLTSVDPVVPLEQSIQQVLHDFVSQAKARQERSADECLLVIGPRYAELYLANESRDNAAVNGRILPSTPEPRFTILSDDDAVTQFFRSALGWMPDGERERSHLEAFRRGHALASEQGITGVALNRLFQRALWLFEKVRMDTDFFRNPMTIDDVLIEVAGKIFGGLKERSAWLVGGSEEIPRVAEALRQAGISSLYFSPLAPAASSLKNRGEFIAQPHEIEQLPFIDLLLLCDGGDKNLAERRFLQKLMAARHHAPLLLADLSAAAMAGEAIEKMNNLFFFRRRDLLSLVEQSVRVRRLIEGEVVAWIREEVKQFYQWLRSEDRFHFGSMVGRSRQMQGVFELIARIAQTDITVLIEGESGTGKELVARAIHQASSRAHRPFIAVNCGALPESLLESELFGHVRGAFTGAVSNKRGLFEETNGGTIFLDEIGEMSPALQVKLLRFLQDGEIKRVGSNETLKLDVRVIAATNRRLQQMVNEGQFRSDLYYRLNVIGINLPPLRERPEDVEFLAGYFLRKFAQRMRKPVSGISGEAMQRLREYHWPGNVRELENVLERAVALAADNKLDTLDLPPTVRDASLATHVPARLSLKEVERQHILETVDACNGNYDEAARVLGIGRTTLWRKLKEYGSENERPNS
ncbi:sigma 54-interacting transcriptional regulator [candidate division KSB1 bacterium]|nr:sigma 54-interacting transcriptional regulator [candidate division KSB1 bacterium]